MIRKYKIFDQNQGYIYCNAIIIMLENNELLKENLIWHSIRPINLRVYVPSYDL